MKKNKPQENKSSKVVSDTKTNLVDSNSNETYNQLTEMQNQLEESQKKYLLLLSDFENYKRRSVKEKEDLVTGTKVKMLQSILDMDNDLSFAVKSSGQISDGMKLIINKLENFLKSQGIETIQTETYDEDLHEVLSVIQSDKTGIVDVVSKGYTLNGKPFRYPKIILSNNEN